MRSRHKEGCHVQPPCVKDCPGRHPGCHDHCGPYQAFHRERMEILEERNKKEDAIQGRVGLYKMMKQDTIRQKQGRR